MSIASEQQKGTRTLVCTYMLPGRLKNRLELRHCAQVCSMLLLPQTIHSFISLKLCDYAILLKEKYPFPNILNIMWREGCELASKHQKYKHSSLDCAHLGLFGWFLFFFFPGCSFWSHVVPVAAQLLCH